MARLPDPGRPGQGRSHPLPQTVTHSPYDQDRYVMLVTAEGEEDGNG